jgi:hypothetical protein
MPGGSQRLGVQDNVGRPRITVAGLTYAARVDVVSPAADAHPLTPEDTVGLDMQRIL